ncbi:hypothetical protein PROVALCAL_01670 [Providencia alcalifaciens DSM 30120]|uniref:Uncharacterized protein n=1 Tax=Providencia alcalifaciens DSM 30120 TaxID=520999 RepID=B6XE91_9GAMM|nr:hypothetical protein PROVALCAL_01670 [Providencia alcalifaciens DSM 30120]
MKDYYPYNLIVIIQAVADSGSLKVFTDQFVVVLYVLQQSDIDPLGTSIIFIHIDINE